MSRRWTGWVLTAAAIAAGPAPALSSNDLHQDPDQAVRPTVTHAGAVPLLRVAGDDGDYTHCLEVTPVQQPHSGLQTMAAGKGPPVDVYVPEHRAEGIAAEIARAKGGTADQATSGSLLIDRELPPNGMARPDQIKAACGIPRELTLLVPARPEQSP
jgi:hypothetical protein